MIHHPRFTPPHLQGAALARGRTGVSGRAFTAAAYPRQGRPERHVRGEGAEKGAHSRAAHRQKGVCRAGVTGCWPRQAQPASYLLQCECFIWRLMFCSALLYLCFLWEENDLRSCYSFNSRAGGLVFPVSTPLPRGISVSRSRSSALRHTRKLVRFCHTYSSC